MDPIQRWEDTEENLAAFRNQLSTLNEAIRARLKRNEDATFLVQKRKKLQNPLFRWEREEEAAFWSVVKVFSIRLAGSGRPKLASSKLSVAKLPRAIQQALQNLRVKQRVLPVDFATSYTTYSAGDDGNRGFVIVADLNVSPPTVQVFQGAWGGGALGGKPSPVDAVNQPSRALQPGMLVIKGQTGGDPYALLYMNRETLSYLEGGKAAAKEKLVFNKPFQLTPKEIARAEELQGLNGVRATVTFVVRPQSDGRFLVALVDMKNRLPLFNTFYTLVEDRNQIQPAVRSLSRDVEKSTGYWSGMTEKSRFRYAKTWTPESRLLEALNKADQAVAHMSLLARETPYARQNADKALRLMEAAVQVMSRDVARDLNLPGYG